MEADVQSCISGKMSTLSITPSSSTMVIPEEEKFFVGEEAIGKKIRIFDEGCVLWMNGVFCEYAFERDDDGKLEPIHLKDQMMELGIVEKEEDIDGKRIRVYDEGVVWVFREKIGMHYVKLDDGRLRALVLHDHEGNFFNNNIEWEQEWLHLRRKSDDDQLPAVKRIPIINEDLRREWLRSFDNIN